MKKFLSLLLISFSLISFAQTDDNSSRPQNELSANLLDLVVAGTLNLNYERLLENNQSFAISASFFDTYGYYDAGYIDENKAISLKASYLIYFSKSKDHAGFFFYPFAKLRTGKITIDDYGYYDFDTDSYVDEQFTYDTKGFSAGFGLGHKWIFNDKISLGLQGEIARNLGSIDDYLDNIEGKFAVSFGFRF